MNILIVCDNFTNGGLEKHIGLLYDNLKNKYNFYFAIGNYLGSIFPDEIVLKNFNFSKNSTIKEFCEDVDRLVDVIKRYKIDIINVHPYYAIFPIIFAAHITGTKVVYTYHGATSFSFPSMLNDSVLFEFAAENLFSSILCVNAFGIDSFASMNYKNTFMLPNPIDCQKYKKTKIANNKKWALVSRLDSDKVTEILKFLSLLPKLDIEKVDIYGSGEEENKLKEYVINNNLNVEFKGYVEELHVALLNNYNGIIGLGRVAMEGLCMNYPVLLIGYGKILGLIDKKNIKYLKAHNFVNSELEELSIDDLVKQIESINSKKYSKYLLKYEMCRYCDVDVVADKYIYFLKNAKFGSNVKVIELYKKIKELSDTFASEEVFCDCVYVADLLIKYLGNITKSIHVKNLLSLLNSIVALKKNIWSLNDRLVKIEEKM